MTILACKVVEKSLIKNFILQSKDEKKIGPIQGRISRRSLVLNPTIQQVITNLQIQYDHSSLHGCGEILDEKFQSSKNGRKENWTNTGKNKRRKNIGQIQGRINGES